MGHFQPCRVAGKRVEGRLECHHDADPATGYLRACCHSPGAHGVNPGHGLAPQTRMLAHLNQQAGQRPSGECSSLFHGCKLARAEVGVDFEHAAAGALHGQCQAGQFRLAGG